MQLRSLLELCTHAYCEHDKRCICKVCLKSGCFFGSELPLRKCEDHAVRYALLKQRSWFGWFDHTTKQSS